MLENYLLLLGGLAGRTLVVLHGVPDGMQAVTIPFEGAGRRKFPVTASDAHVSIVSMS